MKENDYINAVNKLEFSDNLVEKVRAANYARPGFRVGRAAVLAALLSCFMITTVFSAISVLREHPTGVEIVATDKEDPTDASYMAFSVSEMSAGVKKHYMELDAAEQYHLRHGLLWNGENVYLRITDDYQLEPVEMKQINLTLEKNQRTYHLVFDYIETEDGILSNHRTPYYKDGNGEILLIATDGNSGQWPVFFNPEAGTIRDALPKWTAEDFEGRIGYGDSLKSGILISTIVNDGKSDARNILYWIAPGAEEATVIDLPGPGHWDVGNDTIYYQNSAGKLYRMEDDFQFNLICGYETQDYLQDGLLTVCVRNKLGILDAYTGELYVFEEIQGNPKELSYYHAIRYGIDDTIALTHTQWRHDPERTVLCGLGVLNVQTAKLDLLEIESDCDGYQHGWLDASRLAVVLKTADRQFLCIYEFAR